jgi:ABC-type multidrug transport system fused ATPase/permease subunit
MKKPKRKHAEMSSSKLDGYDIASLIKGFFKEHTGIIVTYLVLVILTSVLNIVFVSKLSARFQKNVADADVTSGYRSLLIMMVILLFSFVLGYITDVLENKLFPMFVAWAESNVLNMILKKNEANPELDVDANVYRQILLRTSSSASHVLQQLLYNIIPNGIVLIVMFGFLFKLNWRFGLVFLAVAVVVGAIAMGSKNVVMEKAKCQETISKEAEWKAFDILFNMQLVVSKNMVKTESQAMSDQFGVVCEDKIKYLQLVDNLGYLVQTASYVGVFVVFFLALKLFGRKLKKGMSKTAKDQESKLVLTLISVLMGVRVRLQNLTKSQISTVDSVGKYGHISEKIKEIHAKRVVEGTEKEGKDGSLTFDNVNFHYGDKHVLKGVSLKIKNNETVVVKGKSGSGKSTLAKTCLRIVEPESGQVLVGQKKVQDYSLASLKRMVSFVNPDLGILNRTIKENIMYGIPKNHHVYSSKLEEAKNLWNEFSNVFDGKTLDSRAGVAGGVELSTGQKQLVRLMNLLVCGNNGILILDEPCSGMDPKTKKYVLKLIDNIRKSRTRTMLVITHDAEVGKVADRTFLMTNGTLVAIQKTE